MLNIEKYRDRLENYKTSLDCDIRRIRENPEEIKKCSCASKSCFECRKENMQWLLEEYKEQILDDAEKKYLKAVIKPFKQHVKTIMKAKQVATLYAITIDIEEKYNYETFLQFPPFEKSSGMYKGMELGKEYTLKELGLDND